MPDGYGTRAVSEHPKPQHLLGLRDFPKKGVDAYFKKGLLESWEGNSLQKFWRIPEKDVYLRINEFLWHRLNILQ
jgi:hypothetical protein